MAHLIRLVAAIALLLLAGVAVTPAVADDTDSSRLTWSVSPADAEGSDGRARLEYLVEPGTEVRDHVVVRNLGSETITIELAALDARQTPDNAFELLAPDERSARVGAWIKLDASTVRVSPRNETVVGFSLTLPPDAEPGDHAGGIVAVSTATAADGPDVQYRVGTRAYVRVVGPISAAVQLHQLDARFAATPILVTPYLFPSVGTRQLPSQVIRLVRWSMPGRRGLAKTSRYPHSSNRPAPLARQHRQSATLLPPPTARTPLRLTGAAREAAALSSPHRDRVHPGDVPDDDAVGQYRSGGYASRNRSARSA